MSIQANVILGVALGVEYVPGIPQIDYPSSLIVDLFFIRIIIQW